MKSPIAIPIIIVILLLSITHASSGQEASTASSDSTRTPFRKGRWLTGLSGSISANNSETNASGQKVFDNEYSLNFSNGKFFKDRWLLGYRLNLSRTSTNEFGSKESEILFVGPVLNHYLMKGDQGSVFLTLSSGYARFFQKSTIQVANTSNQEKLKGNGFGTELGMGYSYVIRDRIIFDLRLAVNSFRISADRTLEPVGASSKESLNFGGLSLTFGFNVLLDKFFF